ncbi:MAG: hydroxyethylthiazole kinase [Rhodobacteraceae bacterium]|jgi:hydroxyethylthiazole kinase|uniref:hydroxyethylthiazole kinase n=1 Tax=Marivita sp. TaxID=2003365 RepID=UPI003B51D2CA|nr:hydroxyethylthiazole kinase [Paracoccaceae bacterium]
MTPNSALLKLRDNSPLVHCITNYVAMNIAANVTLAAGASPAMIHAPEEVADFSPIASALTINIGTLSAPWVESMKAAAIAANGAEVPWVFDPVAHFATPYRARVALDLLALKPTVVRGNASEIIALAGGAGSGKGADSGDSVRDAENAAQTLAAGHDCVVAVSGPVDFITDGARSARITGGSEIMPKVTALGCSLTALVGAYCAVAPSLDATIAAFLHFAEAGERAGADAGGPGSFSVAFLDMLHTLQPGDLDEMRVSWN